MKIDHLIVATDLEDNSGIATRWAQSAATFFDAEVTVLHVVETGFMSWIKSDVDIFDDEDTKAKLTKVILEWYSNHAEAAPDHVDLRMGSPLAQTTKCVEEKDGGSMVVLARSGKGSFERFFLGSTVQQFVAHPPCAIAIVHPDHTAVNPDHNVVTGTDFSDDAATAVQMAIDVCRSVGTPLHLVHANHLPTSTAYTKVGIGGIDLSTELESMARQKMKTFLETEITAEGVEIQEDLVFDVSAADALLAAVEHDESDLLIVGHNGASALMQNVVGSVTQQVLRSVPCTIIVAPSKV